jgi:hypothetical protein
MSKPLTDFGSPVLIAGGELGLVLGLGTLIFLQMDI